MARSLASASSQYLYNNNTPVSSLPCAVFLWIYPLTAADMVPVSINDGSQSNSLEVMLNSSSGVAEYLRGYINGTDRVNNNVTWSTGQWNHCGVQFKGGSAIEVILNNNVWSGTISDTPSGLDRLWIGCNGASDDYVNGYLAEIGIWNVSLSLAEHTALYRGFSPLFVRPQNLVRYYRFLRTDQERQGYDLTAVNSPTWAVHAPVVYPAPPLFTVPAAIAANALPMAMHYYQTMRA